SLEPVPVSSEWFLVYKLENDVFAIHEPRQWQEVISYLILGKEKALLFDTGNGIGKISGVVNELTSLPVIVINSHTHFDHIGGNSEFRDILAMDTDYTKNNSGGYSNELVWEEVSKEALCGALPDDINISTYHTPNFKVKKFIRDGYKIDLGGRILEVLSTPGHTPDAISILDSDLGLLWVGDLYYDGPIWLFAPETDLDAYYQSVERLSNIVEHLNTLHPAHNGPIADPGSLNLLKKALINIQNGTINGNTLSGGRIEYSFEGFSLIMK
ncbi:MAG: MBL fold metallo-hydrolase, partial [Candidatus Marinimicrobia bacterium]|nr:MBL fold metallo-hydrolase [Candidatus Neomarinimicrobiota bacterium]